MNIKYSFDEPFIKINDAKQEKNKMDDLKVFMKREISNLNKKHMRLSVQYFVL